MLGGHMGARLNTSTARGQVSFWVCPLSSSGPIPGIRSSGAMYAGVPATAPLLTVRCPDGCGMKLFWVVVPL